MNRGKQKWALIILLGAGVALPATALTVPPGFDASVYHQGVGKARHIAVGPDGDLFVRLDDGHADPGVLRLRDTDGDHVADKEIRVLSDSGGTGIEIQDGHLVFSTNTAVYALPLSSAGATGSPAKRSVIGGFPEQRSHNAKSLALAPDGRAFINVGAPSNACQAKPRTPGSAGQQPCPQLEKQASIWQFDLNATNQTREDNATRYVTGLRNAVALEWNSAAGKLFLVQHGRDQLHGLWSDYFTVEDNANLPAEEFHVVDKGDNLGWPYTYFDGRKGQRMQAPEYGGDGKQTASGDYKKPLVAFPAHWAPNDLLFYSGSRSGSRFPEEYHHAAFVAFHGSWNRAPLPQEGYNVAVVPMNASGEVTGQWRVFADDFVGGDSLSSPRNARFRPTGLAQGNDGSLYVVDSVEGRIWKIRYTGNAD